MPLFPPPDDPVIWKPVPNRDVELRVRAAGRDRRPVDGEEHLLADAGENQRLLEVRSR